MKLTPKDLQRTALELENDPDFTRRYQVRYSKETCGTRRSFIRNVLYGQHGVYRTDIEDGEQLRRYFDAKWNITSDSDSEGQRKYDHLPNVWDDIESESEQPKKADKKSAVPASKKEEPTMNTPIEITTKTFVNGTDVSTMTDSQIYALIAGEEMRIRELDAIKNKPKRLTAEITKREAGIQALVEYLDSKE